MTRARSSAVLAALAGFTTLGLVSQASAGVITQTETLAPDLTDWDTSLNFAQFDPSQGTLNSVVYRVAGNVSGTAKAENQGRAARTTLTLKAQINVYDPVSSLVVVSVVPLSSTTNLLSNYDGILDFAGTSGETFDNLRGTSSDSGSITDTASLASFTGLGTIAVPLSSIGSSNASGSGNLITQFSTLAGATLQVDYNFTAAAPEPGSLVLIGVGLAGLGLTRRRRST